MRNGIILAGMMAVAGAAVAAVALATSFNATFDGTPPSPLFNPLSGWDVQVHDRDSSTGGVCP